MDKMQWTTVGSRSGTDGLVSVLTSSGIKSVPGHFFLETMSCPFLLISQIVPGLCGGVSWIDMYLGKPELVGLSCEGMRTGNSSSGDT